VSLTTLSGLNVVVTGKVAGESRETAQSKLRDAGAIVQSSVNVSTDLLVTGGNVGATKMNAARDKGVQVISWEDALAVINGGTARTVAATAPAARVAAAVAGRQYGPMLCLSQEGLPPSGNWHYEVKWDGYRGIARVDGKGGVTLTSRSGKSDYTTQFPQLAAELAQLTTPCVLDGEIVVLDEEGRSDFANMNAGVARFMAFDLLEHEGDGQLARPIESRRALLEKVLRKGTLVTASPWFEDGQQLFTYALGAGIEGIVAKRHGSHYREGARGPEWLKIKLRQMQEFIVVGYTEGKGARAGTAGAFLLGVYDDGGELVFCGSAGTGGTYDDFQRIVGQTKERKTAPLVHDLTRAELRDVTWVKPEVVVQVRFQRWTIDGKLFHPSIQGQRTDKAASDVRREGVAA
jgi:bifunctional non-homologous end joining protein LigD